VRSIWTCSALLLGAALLVVGILMLMPITVELCTNGPHEQDYVCPSYHIVQLGLLKLAEHFTDAITAAATVAVAVFTYTLKKSTDKMWDAGQAT